MDQENQFNFSVRPVNEGASINRWCCMAALRCGQMKQSWCLVPLPLSYDSNRHLAVSIAIGTTQRSLLRLYKGYNWTKKIVTWQCLPGWIYICRPNHWQGRSNCCDFRSRLWNCIKCRILWDLQNKCVQIFKSSYNAFCTNCKGNIIIRSVVFMSLDEVGLSGSEFMLYVLNNLIKIFRIQPLVYNYHYMLHPQ